MPAPSRHRRRTRRPGSTTTGAGGTAGFEIVGDFDALAAAARRVRQLGDRDVARELRKTVKDAAKPLQAELKRAARGIPSSRGVRSRKAGAGLRRRIAGAVKIKASVSGNPRVRVVLDGRKLGDQAAVARGLDDPGGFRHPVFGNRDVWVNQRGHPWWTPTVTREGPKAGRKLSADLGEFIRRRLD